MARTVLILGASYAGLTIAHKLLKHTRKAVKDLKVVLVNPSTHFYWNLASIRAIIPGLLKDEAIFQDIAKGFSYAAADAFEFVLGTADGLDTEAKTVSIMTASGQGTQNYDVLVLATGSRSIGDVPWKATGSYEDTRNALHKTRDKVTAATSIVIAGGGATGVELAGELGYEYGRKKTITLVTAGAIVMEGSLPTSILKGVEKDLRKLHVTIVHNSKATPTTTPSGQVEVALTSGEALAADVYLPTYGLLPNTDFLPKSLLNPKDEVMVNEFMQAKSVTDVWAAGDIVDIQRNGFVITEPQAAHVAKNLDLVLKNKAPVAYKIPTDMLSISLGRRGGTGAMGVFKLPSMIVWLAKSRTLGVDRMDGYVSGSSF